MPEWKLPRLASVKRWIVMANEMTALIATLVMCVATAAHAQTQFMRDFSADLVSQVNGQETTARFYASKSRTRSEFLRDGVVRSVMIMDLHNHSGWQLRPQAKVATDMSAFLKSPQNSTNKDVLTGAPPDPSNPCAALRESTCRKLGSEDVNGRQTQKWEIKDKGGKVMTLWIDPSLPLAVKTQWNGGSAEYRNIKESPQPDNLFQVPPDYRKIPLVLEGGPR
jgi:hypothetical protein